MVSAALPLSLRKASGFPESGRNFAAMPLHGLSFKLKLLYGKPEAFRKDSGKAALARLRNL